MSLPFYFLNVAGFFVRGRTECWPSPPGPDGEPVCMIGATFDPEGLDTIEYRTPDDMRAVCARWAVLNRRPAHEGSLLAEYYLNPEPPPVRFNAASAGRSMGIFEGYAI